MSSRNAFIGKTGTIIEKERCLLISFPHQDVHGLELGDFVASGCNPGTGSSRRSITAYRPIPNVTAEIHGALVEQTVDDISRAHEHFFVFEDGVKLARRDRASDII